MSDYQEEQKSEIEALECIYSDELEVLETKPVYKFIVTVKSQSVTEEDEEAVCQLQFQYVSNYPDHAPVMEILEAENIDEEQTEELLQLMHSQAEENLGMVMAFTIVSAVQERLTDMVEETKKMHEDEVERKKREKEEAEQKHFEGTRVCVETFIEWKVAFDAEMYDLKRLKGITESTTKKLTGRELFMRDASMIDSDVQFLQSEGGETVEVDESLFQDLDDLEIDGEDGDDDPDWEPD